MSETELKGLRVLVIDDNVDTAEAIALLLADAGAETSVATDATDVAARVLAFDPGMVLLDLSLPTVDGYEGCRAIRALEGLQPYIVAVTGWDGAEHVWRCRQAGFDLHLTKPVAAELLVEHAHLALRRSAQRQG
ncbi:response regulator [Paucibacter sp. R3-3]|uniref:Response regulator n=1 Tax=Roseateles agri TaxID=3098619 RepID=A0ABU5DMV4_9BURK|nr:response regulator [Paucibacter sp. R3-3]MDY0747635.1 response regulator [Paucibacter sp. R3-3]